MAIVLPEKRGWWASQHIIIKFFIVGFAAFVGIGIIAINSDPPIPESGKDHFINKLSAWNGSYQPLVSAVKKRLNDPNSFEHIQTQFFYNQTPNRCLIWMDYRVKNGFGGYVKAEAQCYTDSSGNLVEVTEYGRPDQ